MDNPTSNTSTSGGASIKTDIYWKMIDIDFDDGHYCDFISSENADVSCTETEDEWNGDAAVSKKRLLLKGSRVPYLTESRLGRNGEVVNGNTKEAIFNKFETLSIEDKEPLTDMILSSDRDGDNVLFIAIIDKRTYISLLLIDLISHYSRLKVYNKLYQTALHLATLTNAFKLVRRLVVAGIEVDMRDRFGNTALHISCKKGFLAVAKALLTAVTYQETKLNSYEIPYQPIPQSFNIRNADGLTCLHLAVIHNHRDMVELLLSRDANINVIEMKAGKTCLHIAAETGNEAMVEVVLSKSRPKLGTQTFAGYTATELAHYRSHDRIVYWLRCRGALAVRSIDTIERTPDESEDSALDDCGEDESDNEITYDDTCYMHINSLWN